jgi:hypothetical protein
MRAMADSRDVARILLASIRLFNGLAALVAPRMLAGRLGIDTDANPAALYVMRMFGVRTVLIGLDLFVLKGERRSEALRQAVLIHASDTLAAFLASRKPEFPRPMARVIVLISAVNTALAIYASR